MNLIRLTTISLAAISPIAFAPSPSAAKSCVRSEAKALTANIIPFWLERCYETEADLLTPSELGSYRELTAAKDCKGARDIYSTALLRRHPDMPLDVPPALAGADWMRFIIERNAHDLYFCIASVKLRTALAEIERLGIDAGPFPGFRAAIEAGGAGTLPAAVDDRNHALIDLGWLAEADHAPAQALVAEMALDRRIVDLLPGYGLFLIERAALRNLTIESTDLLRQRASRGLAPDVAREIKELAMQPHADYFQWYYRQPKGRLGSIDE